MPPNGNNYQIDRPTSSVTTPSTTYAPTFNMSSPFGKILDTLGKSLSTQNAWTKANPYKNYYDPYKAQADTYVNQTITPWYNQYQFNPFQQQQSAGMASGGSRMYGTAPLNYLNAANQLQSQYLAPQIQQAYSLADQWASDAYNQAYKNAMNSPTAFNNIGA